MNIFKEALAAKNQLKGVVPATPLTENLNLSDEFESTILLKREDLQIVRSYKIRGAYNKMSSLTEAEKKQGIVCASAGNHPAARWQAGFGRGRKMPSRCGRWCSSRWGRQRRKRRSARRRWTPRPHRC